MPERLSRRERRRLYEETEWKPKEHQGTPYPCAQRVLDGYLKLTKPNYNRPSRLYVSPVNHHFCDIHQ